VIIFDDFIALRGVSKGVYPFACWGIFSVMQWSVKKMPE
jgi:hypothetical protein